jgi:hypothetical protein
MVAGLAALRRARIERSERALGLRGEPAGTASGSGGADEARARAPEVSPPIVRA